MTPENLIEINFQRGNFEIAPQNRLWINWGSNFGDHGIIIMTTISGLLQVTSKNAMQNKG